MNLFTYDTYQDVRKNLFYYSIPFLIAAGFFCYWRILSPARQETIWSLFSYITNSEGWKAIEPAVIRTRSNQITPIMASKIRPDVRTRWRDVWVGAIMTAIFFVIGKWALGLYLGSGTAASAYGAASSLVTLLLWAYYSSQILLFGAEFTQVYANRGGMRIKPDNYAVRIERKEIEKPPR
jgi:hypothetical protein